MNNTDASTTDSVRVVRHPCRRVPPIGARLFGVPRASQCPSSSSASSLGVSSSMSSIIVNAVKFLTPPPPSVDENYDGLEYSWRFLVFRPALFQTEALLLGAVVIYILSWWFGKASNYNRANSWCVVYFETSLRVVHLAARLKAHLGLYEKQFSKPSVGGLVADGYSDFFNFSTGRRAIASLHTVFTLRPRHDLFQLIYQFGWGMADLNYAPQDDVELDFKLQSDVAIPDFIWAIVAKDELKSIKDGRWDLTWTKTTEHAGLPATVSVMSEFADITDNIVKFSAPLIAALKDPKIQPYFRSLSITDQPRTRPTRLTYPRDKRVLLSLKSLPPSKAADSVPLVTAIFSFIDSLEKINLRPETKTKLKKAREEFSTELKEELEKDKREEAAEEKQAAKRKAEKERISKLSAAEQQKASPDFQPLLHSTVY
ncbi:hypothetical protein EVG20_g7256 [Dentipellis fragilis]|uniref:DUF1682-domain-containing protein n=1 Tax=Dentipellis fragilis TaxID=205917 RepID=A0A4Y9YFW4_9AGAM|nr:hypothetical protein EVG20_g7256 [Dentipellis fragilis]